MVVAKGLPLPSALSNRLAVHRGAANGELMHGHYWFRPSFGGTWRWCLSRVRVPVLYCNTADEAAAYSTYASPRWKQLSAVPVPVPVPAGPALGWSKCETVQIRQGNRLLR